MSGGGLCPPIAAACFGSVATINTLLVLLVYLLGPLLLLLLPLYDDGFHRTMATVFAGGQQDRIVDYSSSDQLAWHF